MNRRQARADSGDLPHRTKRTGGSGWGVVGLVAVVGCFLVVMGIRDLASPATCDGHVMSADDTCWRYGRGSERLQSPLTTTVTLPARPKPTIPDGMAGEVPATRATLGPTVIPTVVPPGKGKSRETQIGLNRFEGVAMIVGGLVFLVLPAVVVIRTLRGRPDRTDPPQSETSPSQ